MYMDSGVNSRSIAPRAVSPVLLPALALTVMVVAVLQTLVVPVVGQIGAALDVSTSAVGWTIPRTCSPRRAPPPSSARPAAGPAALPARSGSLPAARFGPLPPP